MIKCRTWCTPCISLKPRVMQLIKMSFTKTINPPSVGVELISTLLAKVLLGYEHNYIVHAFLYATEKCRVCTPTQTEDWRRTKLMRKRKIQSSTPSTLHLSPSPKFARVDPLNPWTRIQLVCSWNYGFVTTWGQHLSMLWWRTNSKPGGGSIAARHR